MWYKLAKKMDWSQAYLSKVKNGYIRPSMMMVGRAHAVVRRNYKWWQDSSLADIQARLEVCRRRIV